MDDQVISTMGMLKAIEQKDDRGNPVPFSFQYVTFNRNSKKGGKLKGYDQATIATRSGDKPKNYNSEGHLSSRTPNHHANMTRNFFIGDSTHPQTFNIRAITRFNGKKVVY